MFRGKNARYPTKTNGIMGQIQIFDGSKLQCLSKDPTSFVVNIAATTIETLQLRRPRFKKWKEFKNSPWSESISLQSQDLQWKIVSAIS
mmetsp:Transcript_12586/g.25651  ORF Transcript_12586/g.25651 Transcript_12586/m.25651 type:complete len:89 (-) Transcript_12586:376-642(-)